MNAPAYRWTCLNCAAANPPDQGECAACSFPAQASGADLAAFRAGKPLPAKGPWHLPLLAKAGGAINSFAQFPLLKKGWVAQWILAAITPFLTLALAVQETHHQHYGPAPWVTMVSIAFIGWLCATPALFLSGLFCLLADRAKEKQRVKASGRYIVLACIFTFLSILFAGLLVTAVVID